MSSGQRNMVRWLLLAAVSGLAGGACLAGSIWEKGNRRTQAIYTDDTARGVGDILTIVINERTVIDNKTDRSMAKKTSRKAGISGTLDLANAIGKPVGEHIFDFPNLDLSTSSDASFEGKADYGADRRVLDQITVTVQDLLPNGNMVVVGTRTREVDGDVQTIQVSGIVRPSDVTFANTVRSDQVAEFHIVYKGRGPDSRYTSPGWLTRLANVLNPF